ncbi:sulfotransferase family 2 domain-containing protein [Methylobacillus flagellatus]|uniref:sulfotransferase family 2 domain-containing protein n=1 Tax=Methylobacillus flagellatus TaxID=405 RepID=UPI0010F89746|nr:sulfotransferase family 2 domain-containing protein [Methylobacillus flagellatus]
MIISHRHKFIFMKTNKTAGTSIEIALSKFCGPDDIITSISAEDEKIRQQLGYPGPQNHLAGPLEYRTRDVVKLLLKRKLKPRFYNHITSTQVRSLIGEDIWNSYYKFCFERNPWDRVISHYYWKHKTEPRPPLMEFIAGGGLEALKRWGYNLYTIDGQVAVDKVCRFENIADELEQVRLHLGVPEKLELPNAKSRFRKDKRSYRDIMTAEEQATVAELFQNEIKLFGYTF